MPRKQRRKFKLGDTVVFDPRGLGRAYWRALSEKDRRKYYGDVGYGARRPPIFTFIYEHVQQRGHCMLISMKNQRIEVMRHTAEFRLAKDYEV